MTSIFLRMLFPYMCAVPLLGSYSPVRTDLETQESMCPQQNASFTYIHCGCFACSIVTQKCRDLPFIKIQRQVIDGKRLLPFSRKEA